MHLLEVQACQGGASLLPMESFSPRMKDDHESPTWGQPDTPRTRGGRISRKCSIRSLDSPDLTFTQTRSWGSTSVPDEPREDANVSLYHAPTLLQSHRTRLQHGEVSQSTGASPAMEEAIYEDDDDDEDEDEDEAGDTLEMEMDTGIYTAVVLAAFSGIHTKTLDGLGWMSVHPLVILFLCFPLFVSQISAMLALRLGIMRSILSEEIRPTESLVVLKVMMTLCLQMMTFSYLMRTLKLLVFVMNPLTWIDVVHFRDEWGQVARRRYWVRRLMRFLCHPVVLSASSSLACLMRFIIGYMVHIDSVSIILAASEVRGAIFDSMAVTFITELQVFYWETCQYVFRIKSQRAFRFEMNRYAWTSEGKLSEATRHRLVCPNFVRCVANWLPCLRLGQGVSSFQTAFIFGLLFLLYVRQIMVVAFALETKKLPVARDVCTTWRWMHKRDQAWWNPVVLGFNVVLHVSPLDLKKDIENEVNGTLCAPDGEFTAMTLEDIMHMIHARPAGILGGVALVCVLLLGRTCLVCLIRTGHKLHSVPDDDAWSCEGMCATGSLKSAEETMACWPSRSNSMRSSPKDAGTGTSSSSSSKRFRRSQSAGKMEPSLSRKSAGGGQTRTEKIRENFPSSWLPFWQQSAPPADCSPKGALVRPTKEAIGGTAELRELQTSLLNPATAAA